MLQMCEWVMSWLLCRSTDMVFRHTFIICIKCSFSKLEHSDNMPDKDVPPLGIRVKRNSQTDEVRSDRMGFPSCLRNCL